MDKIKNKAVAKVFATYPEPFRKKLLTLRQLILDTAANSEEVTNMEETVKWGEPSYVTKSGSTIRMAWNASTPEQYALYFNCKSKLVDTFKELYGDALKFEGNRAIVFNKRDKLPLSKLRYCILLALTYHKRKHLPLLGA